MKYETVDGYTIMYAHLDKALVKPKDKITKGQIVAHSGNTGASTGPHLHFTVWKNGELIDPVHYVKLPLRVASGGG